MKHSGNQGGRPPKYTDPVKKLIAMELSLWKDLKAIYPHLTWTGAVQAAVAHRIRAGKTKVDGARVGR